MGEKYHFDPFFTIVTTFQLMINSLSGYHLRNKMVIYTTISCQLKKLNYNAEASYIKSKVHPIMLQVVTAKINHV
jgi:hypothetical protein